MAPERGGVCGGVFRMTGGREARARCQDPGRDTWRRVRQRRQEGTAGDVGEPRSHVAPGARAQPVSWGHCGKVGEGRVSSFRWQCGQSNTGLGEDWPRGRQRSGGPPLPAGVRPEPHDPCPHPLQANETFALVGNVTHYAQVWLNISAEIRSFLEEGRLQQHLHWLQQVAGVPVGGGLQKAARVLGGAGLQKAAGVLGRGGVGGAPGVSPAPLSQASTPSTWRTCGCTPRH